jgi:four helix bundle protein
MIGFSILDSGFSNFVMTETELKQRTKVFGLRILKLIDALPNSRAGKILGGQLGRSGTSVGANYRAACRSRSAAEVISKLSIVEEEADESSYWMEMVAEHGLIPPTKIAPLLNEANELTAIMVAPRKTLLAKDRKSRIQNQKSS